MSHLVIAIDGPSASGKGTISEILAKKLGWSYLDSGSLYRTLALYAINLNIDLDDENKIAELAVHLPISFNDSKVYLDNKDVSLEIRHEDISLTSSFIAKSKIIRLSLLQKQKDFALKDNLVADGRDMGSIVFPDAILKIFVTATPEIRAQRRAKQLGIDLNDPAYIRILEDIRRRDYIDYNREHSPLIKLPDAYLLDNSNLSIEESVDTILSLYNNFKK